MGRLCVGAVRVGGEEPRAVDEHADLRLGEGAHERVEAEAAAPDGVDAGHEAERFARVRHRRFGDAPPVERVHGDEVGFERLGHRGEHLRRARPEPEPHTRRVAGMDLHTRRGDEVSGREGLHGVCAGRERAEDEAPPLVGGCVAPGARHRHVHARHRPLRALLHDAPREDARRLCKSARAEEKRDEHERPKKTRDRRHHETVYASRKERGSKLRFRRQGVMKNRKALRRREPR